MNSILRLLLCCLFICLSGCATQHMQQVKQCKAVCLQKFNECRSTCTNNCPNCSASSSHTSSTNYAKYVHQERIMGGIVARELNSYRDPLQCRKVSCNCSADLSTCAQNCTGIIQKRLEAVPYCI